MKSRRLHNSTLSCIVTAFTLLYWPGQYPFAQALEYKGEVSFEHQISLREANMFECTLDS